MTPLSNSSLNAERARVDASRTSPTTEVAPGSEAGQGGGFADLLRGAQVSTSPQPVKPITQQPAPKAAIAAATGQGQARPTSAAAAAPAAADQALARKDSRSAPQQPSTDTARAERAERADRTDGRDDSGDTPHAGEADASTQRDTLAHWLLNQGAYLQDPSQAATPRADALPPPQNPAAAADDLQAASIAREVLDAVRSRAKATASSLGKLTDASASQATEAQTQLGRQAGDTDTLDEAKLGDRAGPAVAAEAVPAREGLRHETAATRFQDRLDGAMQALTPLPAPVPDATSAVAPSAAPAEAMIETPVMHPAFAEAVGVSISQLARDGVQEARLQLNPAELGPVSVRIAMHGQEARLELGAAHAHTRALLDASLPALTEAFRADGLVLAASQVSDWQDPRAGGMDLSGGMGAQGGQPDGRGASGGDARPTPMRTGWAGRAAGEADQSLPAPQSWPARGLGGLDLYA